MFKNKTEKHNVLKRLAFISIVNNFVLFAAVVQHRNAFHILESANSVITERARIYEDAYHKASLKLCDQNIWLRRNHPDVYFEMKEKLSK